MSILITPIQLAAYTLVVLATSCIILASLVWRGKIKKSHAILAYRALEERCRDITALAAKTWPVLEPLRGCTYTAALVAIFREAKALNEAVHGMLRGGDSKGFFDPIEAVKFAAAREGELRRVEECLREMEGRRSFSTITPANKVAELVAWTLNGVRPKNSPDITYLARQLHDIVRALEDADYPSINPAETILQLLNTDRTVRPFPKGLPSNVQPPFEAEGELAGLLELRGLRERLEKVNAQFRRTVDVCAPHAINVPFVDDLPMYVRTVLEQAEANSFTRGVNYAHRQQLEEKRGRKTNVATFLQRAHENNLIDSRLFHELMAVQQLGNVLEGETVVTDGEAS